MGLTVDDRSDQRVGGDQSTMHKPVYERLRILKIRIFPRRSVKPKRSLSGTWQRHVVAVAKLARREQRQICPQLEPDAKPLALCGALHACCSGLRTSYR